MGDGSRHGGQYDRSHEETLSEVAHVFRTPLGVISGYAQLLQLRDAPELRMDAVRQIEEAAARLVDAVDLLISLLESESGGLSELFVERSKAARTRQAPTTGEHLDRAPG